MIQSINSDLYSALKVSSASSSTTAKTSSSDSELTVGSQIPKTDTVEISEQARQAMQQSKVAAANTEQTVQADADQQKAAEAAIATANSTKAAASAQQQSNKSDAAVLNSTSSATGTNTEASSTTESPVLSTLTEAQLDKLVSSGTITGTQKNAELARRAAASAQQAASDDINKKSISKAQEQGIASYKQQAAYGVGATTESQSLLDFVA